MEGFNGSVVGRYIEYLAQYQQLLRMMIQEQQGIEDYKFIKGEYASIKIKMQPKSLVLDVPLDWQINKIKCLMVRMIPKLQFDMFVFKHDNQELDGNSVLRELIELDIDQQCINSQHYILTFKKLNSKKYQFEKYYVQKMKSLVTSLEDSPFQPILHPGYYSMKFVNHLNQISQEGGRQLIVNFNQLQQLQNIVQEHRRQNPQEEGELAAQINNRGGILEWLRYGFFKVIQVVSLCTILNMIIKYSDIESFIIVAFVVIIYFAISHLKKKAEDRQKQGQKQEDEQAVKMQSQNVEVSFTGRLYYMVAVFMVSKLCLATQTIITLLFSIFPNWDITFHQFLFHNTHNIIQAKITQWQQKIQPPQPSSNQPSIEKPYIADPKSGQIHKSQAEVKPEGGQLKEGGKVGQQKVHKQ